MVTSTAVAAWRARGRMWPVGGTELFVVDTGAGDGDPLVVIHGFPTSSFDFRHLLDRLAVGRRVLLVDLLGYGLSAKPDRPYRLTEQADLVAEVCAAAGIRRAGLLTHDMGDSVGGELLARTLEGSLDLEVTARVCTNGSIYIEMAHLTEGQRWLLSLPDAALPEDPPQALFTAGLAALFRTPPPAEELDAQWELLCHRGGARLLPRLIRYVEERWRHQDRWTGAIERHPAPLTILWGEDDPVADVAMAHRLAAAVPDARLVVLEGVGHFPMIEAPDRCAAVIPDALAAR